MIPILYDTNETEFTSNGLGRLRDAISVKVVEERNSVYECDFEYPVGGVNYDLIKVGRIIGVSHDATTTSKPVQVRGPITDEDEAMLTDEDDFALTASRTAYVTDYDIQPFDIVSFTRPIDGIVTFHCVHISYRQSYLTVNGTNINSLADAFTLLASAEPNNPFSYQTDKTSAGYLASANGVPKTVRSMLGGVEGSILDAYGGEYEWDKFNVILHSARGIARDFSIRYGVNMLDYNEEFDSQDTYSCCIPYWTDGTTTIVGDMQDSGTPTMTGRNECMPLDVSDKFETQPTKAEVEAMGLSVMSSKNPMIPSQNIHIEFVRLQDMGYENLKNLYDCKLCDTIKVIFPFYNTSSQFKIVKTVWDVLADRYESMELGDLSVTLAEALGISNTNDRKADMTDFVVEQGTSGIWTYRKWNSGVAECWGYSNTTTTTVYGANGGNVSESFPFTFTSAPVYEGSVWVNGDAFAYLCWSNAQASSVSVYFRAPSTSTGASAVIRHYVIGKWK